MIYEVNELVIAEIHPRSGFLRFTDYFGLA